MNFAYSLRRVTDNIQEIADGISALLIILSHFFSEDTKTVAIQIQVKRNPDKKTCFWRVTTLMVPTYGPTEMMKITVIAIALTEVTVENCFVYMGHCCDKEK